MFCYILTLVLGSMEAPLDRDSYSWERSRSQSVTTRPKAGTTAEPSGQVAVRDSKPRTNPSTLSLISNQGREHRSPLEGSCCSWAQILEPPLLVLFKAVAAYSGGKKNQTDDFGKPYYFADWTSKENFPKSHTLIPPD